MRYLSVCSGIEAATVAWEPLGWTPAAFSEIDKFPRAVLKHHYPAVPLHGDFTTIKGDEYGPIDLLVGGTPCQDFSIAGLRAGIAGERGSLTLEFLRLAARTKPRWIVWENVPGVLSADGGRALGAVLGGLAELGYGFAYRVFDAQYFGLAQRRARVFVVGYLGDWRRAAAVLFEPESLQGHPAPRREAGEGTPAKSLCSSDGGIDREDRHTLIMAHGQANAEIGRDQCPTLTLLHEAPILATALRARDGARGVDSDCTDTLIAQAFKPSHFTRGKDGAPSDLVPPLSADADKGDQDTLVCFDTTQITHPENRSNPQPGDPSPSLAKGGHAPAIAFSSRAKGDDGRGYERPPQSYVEHVGALDTVTRHAVAFTAKDYGGDASEEISPTLRSGDFDGSHANGGVMPAVAFALRGREGGAMPEVEGNGDTAGALRAAGGGSSRDYVAFSDLADPVAANQARTYTREGTGNFRMSNAAMTTTAVRRLTPRECERLQGFPDDYTLIPYRGKPAADGPRYKALGNSMAVPVMRWIGERIQMVDQITSAVAAEDPVRATARKAARR